MIYTLKLNFALLLSHFLQNLSTKNIDKVVSIVFSQHQRTYIDPTFLFNHFHPLQIHLGISWTITAESSPLRIGSSQT